MGGLITKNKKMERSYGKEIEGWRFRRNRNGRTEIYFTLLADHPWFEVTTLAASPRSAGKTYEEAVGDRWKMTYTYA